MRGQSMKQTTMNDYLPKPRCTTPIREDYERACELEGVNLNSNIRKMVMDFTKAVFRRHGIKATNVPR